jgi:hypothetical protein
VLGTPLLEDELELLELDAPLDEDELDELLEDELELLLELLLELEELELLLDELLEEELVLPLTEG